MMLNQGMIFDDELQLIGLLIVQGGEQQFEFVVGDAQRRLFGQILFVCASLFVSGSVHDFQVGLQISSKNICLVRGIHFYIQECLREQINCKCIHFLRAQSRTMGKNKNSGLQEEKGAKKGPVKHNEQSSLEDPPSHSQLSREEQPPPVPPQVPREKKKVIKRCQKVKAQKIESSSQEIGYKTNSDNEQKSSSRSSVDQRSRSSSLSKQSSSGSKRHTRRRGQNIKQFIDTSAEESSGQSSSSYDDEDISNHRKERELYDTKLKDGKGAGEKFMKEINDMPEEQINKHYEQRLRNQLREMEDENMGRQDVDLFQVNCIPGMQDEIVGSILNKSRFASIYKNIYCDIISAMSLPKRFPGFVFLQAKKIDKLKESLQSLKGLRLKTLKKIQFELFSNIFQYKEVIQSDFKVQQYIRIRVGMYRGDLAQITKINKKGVVVQVVPRINFSDIRERMKQIEIQYGKLNYKEAQITRMKNTRFKELTDPKFSFQKYRPEKKKLVPSDFEPFTEFYHTKNIKITSQGLLLVNYAFSEIEEPKTTFSALDVLMLNPSDMDKAQVLKQQVKKVKMALDVKLDDLVQVFTGQLKGCYGKVVQRLKKTVRMRCLNPQLKNVVIDEVCDNVEKLFREGDDVVIIEGSYKGEEGRVYKNGLHSVSIVTSNQERIKVLKRDVKMRLQTPLMFENDLGIKKDDIVKTKFELGIVCEVKKNYVDFVTPKNQIKRGLNNELTNVTNFGTRGISIKREVVQRNCLVKVERGNKKDKIFKVKQIYNNFLFLQDPFENNLYGNWVERGENCQIYLFVAPRIEAKFLEDEAKFKKFGYEKSNKPQHFRQANAKPPQEDLFKVGNSYKITCGAFKGVKGVIVASFKTHIDVCVFNNKIERIEREQLERQTRRSRSPTRSEPIVLSPSYENGNGFLSRQER